MDCLEGMREIPDKSIDMILCDLPYGTTSCPWDSIISLDKLWEQYMRIIKQQSAIVLTATQPFTTALINSNLGRFKYTWIWEKTKVGGVFNAKNMPLKSHEEVCIFSMGTTANCSPTRMYYYPQGLIEINKTKNNRKREKDSTIGNRPSRSGSYTQSYTNYPKTILRFANETGLHPTQKPVPLFEYMIKTYNNECQTVLDNCMGSGTTAIACLNTNRNYIGFELDKKYYEKSLERIQNHKIPNQILSNS